MSIAALVETLLAAGVDAATVVAAVRAIEPKEDDRANRKREADRVRIAQKRQMSRESQMSRDNATSPSPEVSEVSPVPPSNLPNPIPKKTPKGVQKGVSEVGVSILLDQGVDPKTLDDWRGVRKAKKAGPITETVANGLTREAEKAGMTPNQAVRMAAERGWQGFNAEWAKNSRAGPSQHPPPQRRGSAALFDAMDRIFPDEPDSKAIPSSAILQLADHRQR